MSNPEIIALAICCGAPIGIGIDLFITMYWDMQKTNEEYNRKQIEYKLALLSLLARRNNGRNDDE